MVCSVRMGFSSCYFLLSGKLCNKYYKHFLRKWPTMKESKKIVKLPPNEDQRKEDVSLIVDQRHVEVLKMEGLGLSRAETVKQVCEKSGCSPRTVYSDFETRASWQPGLQSVAKPEEVQLKVANRCEWIYRQASINVHSSSNESVKLGALNTMLKANSALSDAMVLHDLVCRIKELEKKASEGVFVP